LEQKKTKESKKTVVCVNQLSAQRPVHRAQGFVLISEFVENFFYSAKDFSRYNLPKRG
jgi:hypothetical protein